MTTPHTSPQFQLIRFHCPHCETFAKQDWGQARFGGGDKKSDWISVSTCQSCGDHTVWHQQKLIYPAGSVGPAPSTDMPDSVTAIYEEARAVAQASPRAAAALLRVAVELLVNQLKPGTERLDTKIQLLVNDGLPPGVQQMLDSLRVYGNEGGAHPGEIDLNEKPETVDALMLCLNLVVERMITIERRLDELYSSMPEDQLKGIQNRPKRIKPPTKSDSVAS